VFQPVDSGAPDIPRLELTLEVRAQVGPPIELGTIDHRRHRMVPIVGGTFEGRGGLRTTGRILPGGADKQIIHDDGLTDADARYVLETDRGERVYVRNRGLRHAPPNVMARLLAGELVDPSLVYFYAVPTFETSAPDLQVLTRSIFIGSGERYPSEVVLRFWRVGS
jgi:Protein of unknown function (DUF3237)